MKCELIIVLSVVLAVALLALAGEDEREAQAQRNEYCEMVKLNQDTKGELGWPDYRKNYARVCK